jgi:hypothetical protein
MQQQKLLFYEPIPLPLEVFFDKKQRIYLLDRKFGEQDG